MIIDKNTKVGRCFPIEPKLVTITDELPRDAKSVYCLSNLLTEKVYNGELTTEEYTKIRGEISTCTIQKADLLIKLDIFLLGLSDDIARVELMNLKSKDLYQIAPSKENDKFSCATEIGKKINQLPHLVLANLEKDMPGTDYDKGMLERKEYLQDLLNRLLDKSAPEYQLILEVYVDWVKRTFVTKEFQDFLLNEQDRFITKYIDCLKSKAAAVGKRIDSFKNSVAIEAANKVRIRKIKKDQAYSYIK